MPLINGSPLAVPTGADLEGAWQEAIDIPNPGNGNFVIRRTPGETFEQVLAGNMAFFTDATAGNRQVFAGVIDGNGVQVMTALASATIAPSTQTNISLHGDSSPSYSPSGTQFVIGFPPVLLLPEWQFVVEVLGVGAGDHFTNIGLLYVRIPTRPPQRLADALAVTPAQV